MACSTSARYPQYSWHGALIWRGVISRMPLARVRRTVPELNHGLLNQPSRKAEHDDYGPKAAKRQPQRGGLACGRRRPGIKINGPLKCWG